jgi:cytochrome c-type biogenesis protein CcmH/NrfG
VPRVFNTLGQVYLKQGEKQLAAQAFRRSLSLAPNQDDVRKLLSGLGG